MDTNEDNPEPGPSKGKHESKIVQDRLVSIQRNLPQGFNRNIPNALPNRDYKGSILGPAPHHLGAGYHGSNFRGTHWGTVSRGSTPRNRSCSRGRNHSAQSNDGQSHYNSRPPMGEMNPRSKFHEGQRFRGRGKETSFRSPNQRKPLMILEDFEKRLRNCEPTDILLQIYHERESLSKLLKAPTKDSDVIVLLIRVISSLCQSSFEQLKLKLFRELDIARPSFIENITDFLMDLPTEDKDNNKIYWDKPDEFWRKFIFFCECLVNMSLATELSKYRPLIEATTRLCLDELNTKHDYTLPLDCNNKLCLLRNRIKKEKASGSHLNKTSVANDEPPDNFRELSVVPQRRDLLESRPFLRPNIVEGSYKNVEHYLDVQFRLLREDCFGPLRQGIRQYMDEPTKRKYDHIRVYQNVKFLKPYISNTKVGTLIQLDPRTNRWLQRVNWAHSKRFIFGSVLLFTKDECKTFIVATILDREIKYIQHGQIPISIIVASGDNFNWTYSDESYTMIESEIYFEPYYHVLRALQDPKFPENFAMIRYIVNVEPDSSYPKYIKEDTKIKVEKDDGDHFIFKVFDEETWPTQKQLALDETQFDAFRLALTHELAVIQGPPGTGKTYLGVKVAKTLLQSYKKINGCTVLVICYTNHALDQFLEALIPVTKSIARIGGQSKNEAVEKFNINNLRRSFHSESGRFRLFMEHKDILKTTVFSLKSKYDRLESLSNSVFSYQTIKTYIPECKIIENFYRYNSKNYDPLIHWLFEKMRIVDFSNINSYLSNNNTKEEKEDLEEDIRRSEVILDKLFNEEDYRNYYIADKGIEASFLLSDAETTLKNMIQNFIKASKKNPNLQRHLHPAILDLMSRIEFFKEMSKYRDESSKINVEAVHPAKMSSKDRWCLYFKWADVIIKDLESKIKQLEKSLEFANLTYEEARLMTDLEVLQSCKVVGMTTTGAARLRKLLRELAPPIVIVEEAAEVLETHIVTALTAKCRHLILIGDHQQLRPSVANAKLARHYNMDISLFERLIMNKVHSRRLGVQHRMRPEIAALIVPLIYPELQNHPSVETFPNVLGMTKNLFFLTHNNKEEEVEESSSRTNYGEADLVLPFANYLMQQGYQPEDVTILAAYSGQMFYLKQRRARYYRLSDVKITVVDNYQGEESKIILLSLVRNNDMEKIGFLGNKNRICVALSRAKEGLYIFGNIDILKRNSDLWIEIATVLENNGSLGASMNLQCENHPEEISTISTPEDFSKTPDGGCLLKCNYTYACGHPCPMRCHGYDRKHVDIKCMEKCQRTLCEHNHICPLKCGQKCEPCVVLVEKNLPCGHSHPLKCYQDPTDTAIKCPTTFTVTLPDCGHEAQKQCHEDIKSVKCNVRCENRVDQCGHECLLSCHVKDDPDHEMYLCTKPCARAKNGCTTELVGDRGDHQCLKKCHENCDDCNVLVTKKRSTCTHSEKVPCYEDINETPCKMKCSRSLPCGHFCLNKCCIPCGDCQQKVTKIVPGCNHTAEIECSMEPDRSHCRQKCQRTLPCGHQCGERCDRECDQTLCTKRVDIDYESPCGHKVQLPCNVYTAISADQSNSEKAMMFCKQPCGVELLCRHACGGTCATCTQGRLHVPCTQPCSVTNLCGHSCQEPCNQLCPPCNRRCEVKCPHSRCNNICGAPCTPCQEKCKRRCQHGQCTRRCGEPCSRPPCDQPCDRKLACGHLCRGLCGEPCVRICRDCNPKTFPKDLEGYDFEDNDRLIQLQDCPHILDVATLDNLMMTSYDSINVRACPFCRKPIINTYRYKDLVNHMFKTQINPIKMKVYGHPKQIAQMKNKLKMEIEKLSTMKLDDNILWKSALNNLVNVTRKQKKVSLTKIEMYLVCLNVLDLVADCYKQFKDYALIECKSELLNVISMICIALSSSAKKITQQQQKDIAFEIKRMNGIVQLSKILNNVYIVTSREVEEAKIAAKDAILSLRCYNEEEALETLKRLQDAAQIAGTITKLEREMIVKAIGLKQGHWFKCPKGHFYCIGECGGATQVGKCNECGASIGGQGHTLTEGNAHAPEMDGSRFSAWSNEYNNMANFRLNF